ncbi:MAG TPA: alpha-amylase family glycosyl hydrolase [Ignavibacteriales bacterium]|nr:alpha-amylase family glycosyl hydrolase [Ignavibacteriales bacterium]HOL81852.1 alpha-amylase family glycosyl hydrolase [Ignavibacteriales bacterium]HOM65047.1 alpha-amylase family glycosyl hydrolase [Ignavibacteriales bacterium]HPD67221.1 alpha-amylase family glycosyl hydrolase [Ignavibacteriales bacterium]HPP34011.1 alpha-amylase family glycosyl hydrolase [Ignavibacteriales bacterium]
MKNILILILSLIPFVYAQILSPHPVADGTKFSYKQNMNVKINTVTIAGSFNNWNKRADYMIYDSINKIWTITIKLTKGVEYSYKFVINDSIWIADPNALSDKTDVTNNSIVIPQEFGKPYLIDIYPALYQRVKKLSNITMKIVKINADIDTKSIITKIDNVEAKHKFNPKTGELVIIPPKNIEDGDKKVYIEFMDKDGLSNGGYTTYFYLDRFINEIKTPEFYDSAIMYEIYIRSFCDADGDGIGDFKGLTSKLDYIKSLGVNALWLMPFNESPRPHGYNVVDYFSIEKDYGTFDDYLEFLKEAKKRNIKVIMDFVINHTDSTHPFFLDAVNNPASKYSSYYKFTNNENSNWEHFGAEKCMPKLNYDSKELQDYIIKVAKYWMDPNGDGNFDDGVDGFRCDAAREVPHHFWKRFRKEIKEVNPDVLLLAEIWDGAAMIVPFFKEEFDMCFAFPVRGAITSYVANNDIKELKKRLLEESELYPIGYQMVRFLANHDVSRTMSMVNDNEEKYRLLVFLNNMVYGTPMIYYGDEIGMKGICPPDDNVRLKIDWDEVKKQLNDNYSLLNFNIEVNKIRKHHTTLSQRNDNKTKSIVFSDNGDILSFLRYDKNGMYLILCNNTSQTINNPELKFNKLPQKINTINVVYSNKTEGDNIFVNYKNKILKINNITIKPNGFALIKL